MDCASRIQPLRLGFRLFSLCCIVALLFAPFINAIEQEPLGTAPEVTPKRVAVIGAGAGGSANAYYLRKYADASNRPLNISVFERSSYIGGRSTTVNVFDDARYPVELGASIFVSVNQHLVNASREFGLTVRSASHDRPRESDDTIGIWDGSRFVFVIKDSDGWWTIPKLLWRYGWSPVRTQNLMKRTVAKFLQIYNEPMFPFKSLAFAAAEVGLLDSTSTPGETFLENNNISPGFSREIIQASTRVNYGQNLGLIHGLEAIVCMATDGAVSVEGGNWRIFEGMLMASGADIRLNNAVTSIDRNANGTLTLTSVANDSNKEKHVFDEVVIAGPLQYSNLTMNTPLQHTPDKIPYVTLHVTLFSSPHRLSPKAFNLTEDNLPETILTTLPKETNLGSDRDGVGTPGFWSISTLQTVRSPANNNGEKHYVYKIFSPKRPSASFVAGLLDIDIDESGDSTSEGADTSSSIEDLSKEDISWFHEKIWNPYPFLYPRVTFEDSSLAPNIWYTGGIESFISTMETSALMGRNVAALMERSWGGVGMEDDAGGNSEGFKTEL